MGTQTVTVTAENGSVAIYKVTLPPRQGFQFGVTVGANDSRSPGGTATALQWSYNKVTAALKRDLGQRIKFFGTVSGGGLPKAISMWHASPGHEPSPLLTSELFDLAAWRSLLDTLTVPVNLCYRQEFSDWLSTASQTDVDDFNAKQAQLGNLIATHPNGRLASLQFVGSEFPERQALTPIWKRLTPLPNVRIGCDCYVTQAKHLDVTKAFAASVAWYKDWSAKVPGVRLAVSETGVSRTNFTPTQRIQWLGDASAFLATVDPSGSANYWASDNAVAGSPEKDWSVDQAGDEAVAAKLASLIRG